MILLILIASIVLGGCESSKRDSSKQSQYDRLSQEIERLKAEAAQQAQSAGPMGTNIRIDVSMLTTRLSDYAAVEVLWKYVDRGLVAATRPAAMGQSGLVIGAANDKFQGQLSAVRRNLKMAEETSLFVVVADGSSGQIDIGTEIAVPGFFYLGRWYGGIGYEFRRAGRSLKVTARRLPSGQIEMQLTPAFSRFLSSGGDMELTELTTTVTAPPGQTIVIGGNTSSGQDVATALFGRRTETEQTQSLLTVTPRIQ
jgi:hypothetical protein